MFVKTMSRMCDFYWKFKSQDVKRYVHGGVKCQKFRDYNQRKLTCPEMLEMHDQRWGSLATDFIVGLQGTNHGFDTVTTWVDRLTRRAHFMKSNSTDTAVDVADFLFKNYFKHHGLLDRIVLDRDAKFRSEF